MSGRFIRIVLDVIFLLGVDISLCNWFHVDSVVLRLGDIYIYIYIYIYDGMGVEFKSLYICKHLYRYIYTFINQFITSDRIMSAIDQTGTYFRTWLMELLTNIPVLIQIMRMTYTSYGKKRTTGFVYTFIPRSFIQESATRTPHLKIDGYNTLLS